MSAGGLCPLARNPDVLAASAGGRGPGIDFMFSSLCMACDVWSSSSAKPDRTYNKQRSINIGNN